MKKIVINGRFLSRPMTGVDRYALEITKSIDSLIDQGHPIIRNLRWEVAVQPGNRALPFKHIKPITIPGPRGQFWEQISLPLFSTGKTLLNLCNSAPIIKTEQLVVIHDAATIRVPDSYSWRFRTWYQLIVPSLIRRTKHICTVSNFSKNELQNIYNTTRLIHVLPEGSEHLQNVASDQSIVQSHQLLQRPYVLAVGSMAPHKNFKTLIEAVALLDSPPFNVVIAGGANPRIFSPNQQELPNWVKHVGYVTDEQLRSLYEHAGCFVFPSKYEGYGLPPTEAMSLGCPVICARSASLPEVCEEAAEYFDPNSPQELADLLLSFFNSAEMGARLRARGLDNVKNRTWQNAAMAVIDCLRKE